VAQTWKVEWSEYASKELRRLSHPVQDSIIDYLDKRIATGENPRRFGKGLYGNKAGLWRYRVGNYRIVCGIEDKKLVVMIVEVGHRREIYD